MVGVNDRETAVAALVKDFVSLLFRNHRLTLVRGIALAYIALYRKETAYVV